MHTNRMKTFYSLTAMLAITLIYSAYAQSLNQMNYQGKLVDSSANPLPDGNYTLTFGIWSADYPGGTLLWGPQTNSVTLLGGLFNTVLGPTDSQGRQLTSVFSGNNDVFLQIQVS